MFTGIHHPGYIVENLDDTIAFYENTLGGKCIKRGTPSATGRNAFVQVGDVLMELVEPADKSRLGGRHGQVLDHIGYIVPDIQKAAAELKAKGVRFATPEPTTSIIGVKIWYLDTADTQGTRIHLTQV
ncbi:MAG: VOC family protein [Bacteroidetes bacterium]|nr:VOC family protein [Bacteroidota bacterium]MCL5025250.1 VOC family protein [Chloroflexota bacterium]